MTPLRAIRSRYDHDGMILLHMQAICHRPIVHLISCRFICNLNSCHIFASMSCRCISCHLVSYRSDTPYTCTQAMSPPIPFIFLIADYSSLIVHMNETQVQTTQRSKRLSRSPYYLYTESWAHTEETCANSASHWSEYVP